MYNHSRSLLTQKCSPSQAKWFIRMILKSFPPDLLIDWYTFDTLDLALWPIWTSYPPPTPFLLNFSNADIRAAVSIYFSDERDVPRPHVGTPVRVPTCH